MNKLSYTGLALIGCCAVMNLSGCASLNSDFDCPKTPGVMCSSIDSINQSVNSGDLGSDTTSPVRTATSTPSSTSWGDEGSLNPLGEASAFNASNAYGNFSTPYPSSGPQPGDPLRYQETVLRVWVAPYEDKEGNYYQPTTLYTVVKPGHWVGNPPKAVSDDREE